MNHKINPHPTNLLTVHDHTLRQAAILNVVLPQGLSNSRAHPVSNLGLVSVEVGHRDELCESCIDAGNHSTNRLVLVEAVVVSVVPKHNRVEK